MVKSRIIMEQVISPSSNLVNEGKLLVQRGEYQQAISCYVQALNADLNNPWAFYYLGVCLAKQKRDAEAMSFYIYVIQLQPSFGDAYCALGEIFQAQNQLTEAIACYQEAIAISPQKIKFRMSLGKAWKAQGKIQQALNCFQQVIKLRPNFVWSYLQVGSILRQQGKYQAAIDYYFQALTINPRLPAAYTILEFMPIPEIELERAIALYQKIVQQDPDIFAAWTNLGDALTQKQELTLAVAAYQQAAYHKTIITYPQLAKAYQQLRDRLPNTTTTKATKPDFIIIGVGKCGTTSLYKYLSQHPQVLPAIKKEINFFNFNFEHGIDWYLAHFPALAGEQNLITGEASPSYFSYLHTDHRISESCPQVKLIILLRNPTKRAVSHYYHRVREGIETRSLADALNSELKLIKQAKPQELAYLRGYLGLGLYIYKLQRWLTLFPQENVLILNSEDLELNSSLSLLQTYRFLGLANHALAKYPRHNTGTYSDRIDEQLQVQLSRFFRPYNTALETFLNRTFGWN